jgi:hypothetical protein
MDIRTHCDICKLCGNAEQMPGSLACKNKIKHKFYTGYWHNGTHWHVMQTGRVLTKDTFWHTKKGKQALAKNKKTKTKVVTKYTQQHHELLHEWSNDISGFKQKDQMENFIFYMTSHPFCRMVEYRIDEMLIGFSWLI